MAPKACLPSNSRIDYSCSSYGLFFIPGAWEIARAFLGREVQPEGSFIESLHRQGKKQNMLFDFNPVSLASSFVIKDFSSL